jgi:hypothetical protein
MSVLLIVRHLREVVIPVQTTVEKVAQAQRSPNRQLRIPSAAPLLPWFSQSMSTVAVSTQPNGALPPIGIAMADLNDEDRFLLALVASLEPAPASKRSRVFPAFDSRPVPIIGLTEIGRRGSGGDGRTRCGCSAFA